MVEIVVGAGYGDEGKGSVVNELSKGVVYYDNSYVVRFNGGHQVGHTVVHEGKRHVFSNFGSGSFQRIPTFWSRFCTIHPKGIVNEYDILLSKGCDPVLFIDPLCPVVTPFDIIANQLNEKTLGHGSVGVGFGTTVKRNEGCYKLFAQDLLFKEVYKKKFEQIAKYYSQAYGDYVTEKIDEVYEEHASVFIEDVERMLSIGTLVIDRPPALFDKCCAPDIIFEGGQGILLDQDFGFFPHVTRSNTTSKNAFVLIDEMGIDRRLVKCNLISRAYSTRHGNGPLFGEGIDTSYINKNPNETNVSHEWQGNFRYAPLNLDMLRYAIMCDHNYSNRSSKRLWMTCLDQIDGKSIPCIHRGELLHLELGQINTFLGSWPIVRKMKE